MKKMIFKGLVVMAMMVGASAVAGAKQVTVKFDGADTKVEARTGTVTTVADGQSLTFKIHGETLREIPELSAGKNGLQIGSEDEMLNAQYITLQQELPNMASIEIEASCSNADVIVVCGKGSRSGRLRNNGRFRSSSGSDRSTLEEDPDSYMFEAEESVTGYPVIKFWCEDTTDVKIVSITYTYDE